MKRYKGIRHRHMTQTATLDGPVELFTPDVSHAPTDVAALLTRIGQTSSIGDARTGSTVLPEFRGTHQWVVPQRFFCPTMCGCVVGYQYTFYFSDESLRRFDPLQLEWMTDQHQFNRVTPATATTILRQCADHAHLMGAKALFKEIWHLHGNRHGYACGCTVSIWFDDRVPTDVRIHTPVEHDVHTHRCAKHARLNTVEHYETLMGIHRPRGVERLQGDWRQSVNKAPLPSLVTACG